jgi:hypothetical protein
LDIEAARRPTLRPDPRLVFTQIREDFLRIQVINAELAQAIEQPGALDFKAVGQAAAELKKRASRLKFNLSLPEPEERSERPKVEVEVGAEGLRAALVALGPLIEGFAHNPVFKETKVVDARLSAQARRDLEAIIELSGQVKKSSAQLHKAARKAQ